MDWVDWGSAEVNLAAGGLAAQEVVGWGSAVVAGLGLAVGEMVAVVKVAFRRSVLTSCQYSGS